MACYAILRSSDWHLEFTADSPIGGPQKFHTEPTPRIGGLAILVGLVVASVLFEPAREAELDKHWFLLLSLLPAFIGGFTEDITRKVPSWTRLLLTAITAGFANALVDVRFFRSDVDWLDAAFTFAPFAYAGFLFAVTGVAHAMNIIDGYNGLSGGVGAIILLALGWVAAEHGDLLVGGLCITTAGAMCGFLLFNYPQGRIFLGDGGAYLQGCIIAIAAALLVQRNPGVSPWFPFALVLYPIWETLFSMLRRFVLHRTGFDQPDARHLHSLIYRRLARRWVSRRDAAGAVMRNSITTLPLWAVTTLVALLAVMRAESTGDLQWICLVFIVGYVAVYLRVARLKRPMTRAVANYLKRRQLRRNAIRQKMRPE